MLITVDIPEELVTSLADRGIEPERFLTDFVRASTPRPVRPFDVDAFQASMERLQSIFKDVTVSPDEKFDREMIYQDHD